MTMNPIQKFAPVLIGTLNRYMHFKLCIESLQQCIYSDKTHLFIALDYPPAEKYEEGFLSIKKFIDKGIHGFFKVTVIERKSNLGVRENFFTARELIFTEYDRIIVTEDDNEFSPDFLNFVNNGLSLYNNNPAILAICPYIYPIKIKNLVQDIFLYQGFSAWGYATWREKFQKISWDVSEVKNFLKIKNNRKKITSKHVLSHLRNGIKINKLGGDTFICYYLFCNNMTCIFPKLSRVRNHGYDGSGINCDGNASEQLIYKNQEIYNGNSSYLFPKKLLFNKYLQKEIDFYLLKEIWYYRYLKYPHRIFPRIISKLKRATRKVNT